AGDSPLETAAFASCGAIGAKLVQFAPVRSVASSSLRRGSRCAASVATAAADALADPERVGRGDLLTAASAGPPDDAVGERVQKCVHHRMCSFVGLVVVVVRPSKRRR